MRKRFEQSTISVHDQPVAADVLAQEFVADTPNQRWVTDTTKCVFGRSGKLYRLDLYSPVLVSWAVSAVSNRHLLIRVLQMALKSNRRSPRSDCGNGSPLGQGPAPLAANGCVATLADGGW